MVRIAFYVLALLVATVVVSPCVYALPRHRCPFDLLHHPYAVVGIPLYIFLHAAVLAADRWVPASQVGRYIQKAVPMSLWSLLLFVLSAAWPPFSYIAFGGQ